MVLKGFPLKALLSIKFERKTIMKKRYEVFTFTGRLWENLNNNEFSSRKKAETHMKEWQNAAPNAKFKIVVYGGK